MLAMANVGDDNAGAGTSRRYNFDDNVRDDLYPQEMDRPQCAVCNAVVDTLDESTRTLEMRDSANQPPLCSVHGPGFGAVVMYGMVQYCDRRE